MITTSDPLEYIPGGRQTITRHPLAQNGKSAPKDASDDSFILKKLSHVNISDKKSKEVWSIRENDNYEEELYYSGKVAVHLKGSQSTRMLETCYTCETNIKHALWCVFHTKTPDQLSKDKNPDEEDSPGSSINCICLFDSYTLKVFAESGEDYISSLQFQVTGVWATKFGILMEKHRNVSSSRCSSGEPNKSMFYSDTQLPVVYSLSHPLDEISPVLVKHGHVSYMCDGNQEIIFTSIEPSLAVIYDRKTGLHSVYKIRKATTDECQFICGGTADLPQSPCNYSFTSSFNVRHSNSAGKNCSQKGHISIFGMPNSSISNAGLSGSNALFGSRTSYTPPLATSPSQQQQTQHSRSQSPMAQISRCHSPIHSGFSPLLGVAGNPQQSRLHQTIMASILGVSFHNPSIGPGTNTMQFQDSATEYSKPLYPEICLDYVWTESSNLSKDVIMGRASKVFLTTDLVGQNYLSYLVPARSQLFLVRLEKTNRQQQVIFGMVTSIIAKDAVNLTKLKMMAIMDMSNSVSLYSGVIFVGKVHMPNPLGGHYRLSSIGHSLNASFPRRSSLLSPHGHHDIKFEDGVHLISPVPSSRAANLMDSSFMDTGIVGLKDAVGNKLIMEYGKHGYYMVTLPTPSTSPLVSKCLKAFKSVLQRDLAMQLLAKWYSARNAPGPQDFSPIEEWRLFLNILYGLLGYDVDKLQSFQDAESSSNIEMESSLSVPKKPKTDDSGSNDDWSYVMKSSGSFVSDVLNYSKHPMETSRTAAPAAETIGRINTHACLFAYLPLTLFTLHLLYEELKLSSEMSESLPLLAQLLFQLSSDLRFELYSSYYFRDFPQLCHLSKASPRTSQITDVDLQRITPPNYMLPQPPSVFQTLYDLLNYRNIVPFPFLNQVNPKTRNVIHLVSLVAFEGRSSRLDMTKFVKLIVPVGSRVENYESRSEKEVPRRFENPEVNRIVKLFFEMGLTKEDLKTLPSSVALILKDVMYRCREQPPPNWCKDIYKLIDRQDLAELEKHLEPAETISNENSPGDGVAEPGWDDGMDFDDTVLKLRFNKDHRVSEVRRLLNSSQPVKISIEQRPDVSDHDFIEEQERHLHALCTRTMALPVARGMFTLQTSAPVITEQLPIPRLCLSGRAPPRGTIVELSHIDVPPNMNLWPSFHNGVAAGLRIHPEASNIDSTWIVYNKNQQSELGIEHSGFLMALGLNGHLKNLAPFSTYEYLVEYHEATSVGLLLGLSATYRGTMDVSMTKLLSLHVETLLPPTSIELNIHQNVQVAALLGVGLVYQQTAHRHIAHALLSEIGRPPGPEMKNCVDRESYSLAAGLALGLVVLGHGEGSDLASIPDTLHYYMVGGNVRPFTGSQKDKYKSPSYQIREGNSINVTSPGATIALGLMYFNSGNKAVAEWMRAPDTQYLLDFVRPDLLLLRVLARSLILWDEIRPSRSWISSHIPEIVSKYRLQKPTPDIMQEVDLETMNQAYCNIIAGACLALGLKYAGTANMSAFSTLYNYTETFVSLSHKSIAELAGKSTIETCLNVILLATSIVMAGTGNLEIMRVCRHIRTRVGVANSVVTYGSHLATHMALGFLFLGGGRYTLSNSPAAVAALIISLFPKFPTHSNDNRYHLQALRHLYVLACEPRLILPKDIDNGQFCYANVHLTFTSNDLATGQTVLLKAPCLLPQLDSLKKVVLKDDRYWQIVFEKGHNWHLLESMLKKCGTLDVKQRAGCLSYIEDPNGFRSSLAQPLTTGDIVWTARPEDITSFTNDKTVLNIVNYFSQKSKIIDDPKNLEDSFEANMMSNATTSFKSAVDTSSQLDNTSQKMEITETSTSPSTSKVNLSKSVSQIENSFTKVFATIIYECVVKDKISLLPYWMNLHKIVEEIGARPNSHLMWQIKLVSVVKNYSEDEIRLLNLESILAIKQKTAAIVDSWETELRSVLQEYLKTGSTSCTDANMLDKLSAFLTFYNVPCKINPEILADPFTSNPAAREIEITSLYTLYRILRAN